MGWMEGCDRSVLAADTNSKRRLTRCDGVIIHTIGGGPGPADKATWAVRRDGYTWQHRDDEYQSAANLDGNPYYLAIENGDRGLGWPAWDLNRPDTIPPLTAEQCEANAKILAYVHREYGVPLVLMPDSKPGRRGVGYHRLGIDGNFGSYKYPGRVPGGIKYSSVFGKVCPTDQRIDQVIHVIIPRARVLAGSAGIQEVDLLADERRWLYNNDRVNTAILTDSNTVTQLDANPSTFPMPLISRTKDIRVVQDVHGAALAEILDILRGGDGADAEDRWAKVVTAASDAAERGARDGVTAQILTALQEMEQRLQGDDAEQAREGAREVLAQLRESLPAA